MALYTPQYRMGAQGYMTSKAQAGLLVAATATEDPSAVAGVTDLIGFVDNPSAQRNEGLEPVQTPGSMRVVTHTAGQRTYSVNTRFLVGDGAFIAYAARDHADPDKIGTVMGLPLRTYEWGATSEFGADQADAEQALDGLINSLSIEYREGAPLTSTVDIWPSVILDDDDGVVAQASYTPMTGPVLHWVHLQWLVGGVDYHSILSGCRLQIQNSLQRICTRGQRGASGAEEKISRTAYSIKPGPEMLGLQPSWHDKLPKALRRTGDWSTLTMLAEEPGSGAGRRYLQVAIAHNYLQQWARQASDARGPMTWNSDTLSYELTITHGTTT